jgi:ribose transport system permease protein
VFGRYLVAIGTNESAVRLAGINPRLPKIAVFSITGLLTGLGALFYTSRLGSQIRMPVRGWSSPPLQR